MLPLSIRTFMSLTQAPSTLRSVEVARVTPSLMASSKLLGFVALISVTRATLIGSSFSTDSFLPETAIYPARQKLNAQESAGASRGDGRQLRAWRSSGGPWWVDATLPRVRWSRL